MRLQTGHTAVQLRDDDHFGRCLREQGIQRFRRRQHGGRIDIDKVRGQLVFLRNGDHGFNGDGAVDDGRLRGQGQGLQERMKPTAGRQTRHRCAARLEHTQIAVCDLRQNRWRGNAEQIGSADIYQ